MQQQADPSAEISIIRRFPQNLTIQTRTTLAMIEMKPMMVVAQLGSIGTLNAFKICMENGFIENNPENLEMRKVTLINRKAFIVGLFRAPLNCSPRVVVRCEHFKLAFLHSSHESAFSL